MTFSKLGFDTTTKELITISRPARRQGMYIIGSPGTGKSGLIENLVIEDIKQGLGVCLIDIHGDLINTVLARLPDNRLHDVLYLNFPENTHSFGLNLLECSDPTNDLAVQYTMSQIEHVFEKAYGINPLTPRLYDYLVGCSYTLIVNPGCTLLDIRPLLTDGAFRTRLLKNVKSEDVLTFWDDYEILGQKNPAQQRTERREILNKLNDFSFPPLRAIIGQKTTIDFRSMMDERKIVLLKLDARLENASSLIGATLIAFFLTAAYSRQDMPVEKRKQFHIYADEFQRFATKDFSTLIEESRKFGIGCTLAHQNLTQLDDKNKAAVLGCANIAVFRINSDDSQELKWKFNTTPPVAEPIREQVLTPTSKPFDRLMQGYTHRNERVNQFVTYYLHQSGDLIDENQRYFWDNDKIIFSVSLIFEKSVEELNGLAYKVMRDGHTRRVLTTPEFMRFLMRVFHFTFSPEVTYPYQIQEESLEKIQEHKTYFDWHYKRREFLSRPAYHNEKQYSDAYIEFDLPPMTELDKMTLVLLTRMALKEDVTNELEALMISRVEGHTQAIKAFVEDDKKQYQMFDKVSFRKEKITTHLKALAILLPDLMEVLEILAAEPIASGSGIYEMKPGLQMTYADVANQIANELVALPDFTAKVRVKDATDTTNVEHVIRTIKPGGDDENGVGAKVKPKPPTLFGAALQQRVEDIQANNLRQGYIRQRKDVEEELQKRQSPQVGTQEKAPPTIEPQKSDPPTRPRRSVVSKDAAPSKEISVKKESKKEVVASSPIIDLPTFTRQETIPEAPQTRHFLPFHLNPPELTGGEERKSPMAKTYLCLHGHFYQPPRVNPFTGVIPDEDTHSEHRNFNELITAQCYRPNAVAGNFGHLSYDFGPTLLNWLENTHRDVYDKIIASERVYYNRWWTSNALAQPYNHTILPLSWHYRDKYLQIKWGIDDYTSRFGHEPVGMWLPETAVDLYTLEIMYYYGIRYTILAPWQAKGNIDPTQPYYVRLRGDRKMTVFFYNRELSGNASFNTSALADVDTFASKIVYDNFTKTDNPQIILMATDGELYGHHRANSHKFLERLFNSSAQAADLEVTSLELYMKKHPATREVQIWDNSSWSCTCGLGVGRWSTGCSCTSGDSRWKKTLRDKLNLFAEKAYNIFEEHMRPAIPEMYAARNHYIALKRYLISDRDFWEKWGWNHQKPTDTYLLNKAYKLLEAEYYIQAAFTSCGWFWDRFDRRETQNNIAYAKRAAEIIHQVTGVNLDWYLMF